MTEWQAFRRSLSDHPGVTAGWLWPLLVLGAVTQRKDFAGFGTFSAAGWCALATVAALPWLPILWTAWTGRHQYKEEDHG
jgi:hypothetical protein